MYMQFNAICRSDMLGDGCDGSLARSEERDVHALIPEPQLNHVMKAKIHWYVVHFAKEKNILYF